jgi:nitrite reductase/ring-hydroxylating ferredoxin subunit
MTERIRVADVGEFAAGEQTVVSEGPVEIGVFNVENEYYALSNVCAHESGPVCEGQVRGTLVAEYAGPEDGVIERVTDDPCIACPWHGWEYDLETGEHLGDDDISIPTFPVIVEDGVVYVEI